MNDITIKIKPSVLDIDKLTSGFYVVKCKHNNEYALVLYRTNVLYEYNGELVKGVTYIDGVSTWDTLDQIEFIRKVDRLNIEEK